MVAFFWIFNSILAFQTYPGDGNSRKALEYALYGTKPLNPRLFSLWSRLRACLPGFLDRGRQARKLMQNACALAAAQPLHPAVIARSPEAPPLISLVVPVYNPPPAYLDALLASFQAQFRPGSPDGLFELVLSDDGSTKQATRQWLELHQGERNVRTILNEKNGGIAAATNAGICAAAGEWIALIDHDDAVAPFALERMSAALLDHPSVQFLYTDEVITDGNLDPQDYFLKPAWDEVLLSGMNYINHFSVYRRARLFEIGLLNEGFQGSQDYDLLLRYTACLKRDEILHLPYPAYLWRRDGHSFTAHSMDIATESARNALRVRYSRDGKEVRILPALDPNLHRVDFVREDHDWPLVSVIIPTRNALPLIRQVIEGLRQNTDYPALEIILIDNGSDDPEVHALYASLKHDIPWLRIDIRVEPFNFSRAINRGIALAKGEVLLLLNNDIEIQEPGWLKEMVSCLEYSKAGIVGAKLLYPDSTLQHAGVIAGLGGLAGHWFIQQKRDFPGPMGRLKVRQSLSVVTGACLLVSRECWEKTGPLDEENFAIAYNDVDFCLRAIEQGIRVVWTPFSELIHHESASRGSDETLENIERFRREQDNLRTRHRTDVFEDRAFNPWWTRGHAMPGYQNLQKLPEPR